MTVARSTEQLEEALVKLRTLEPALAQAVPRSAPPTPEEVMMRELRKVHDFCALLLEEVLELRQRHALETDG